MELGIKKCTEIFRGEFFLVLGRGGSGVMWEDLSMEEVFMGEGRLL